MSAKKASLLRIFIFGSLFLIHLPLSLVGYSKLGPEFWSPSGLGKYLPFISPPFAAFSYLEWLWKAALLLACLGFCTKLSKLVVVLGSLIVAQYDQHFSAVLFNYIPEFFLCFYMFFLDDASHFSLDRLVFKKTASSVDGWPVRHLQVFFISLYVFSAIQKIRFSGVGWLSGGSFQSTIRPEFRSYFENAWVVSLLTLGVLTIELFSPLIFFRKCKYFVGGGLLTLHVANYIFLDISASIWMVCLATFLAL